MRKIKQFLFNRRGKAGWAALAVLLAGCVTIYNPATRQRETYFITEQTELAMGKNLAEQIAREEPLVKDQRILSYVRDIGTKVARFSDRTNLAYHFNVIDDDTLNAFALPGGYVFVNRGLVSRTSRDELAFVLGHEIGHICARHSLKRMQVALGVNLLFDLALKDPESAYLRRGLNIVYQAVSSGYSRQDELLADTLGATYAFRSGFDPRAAVTMIEKLKNESSQAPIVFLSSHPTPDTRIKNLRTVAGKLGREP